MTLTEKLNQLEKEASKAEKTEKSTPSNVIYPVRSGTKNIKVNWNIGGNFKNIKKVVRNPTTIFGASHIQGGISGVTGQPEEEVDAGGGVFNIKRASRLLNQDVKPVMALGVQKVYGMVLMGGKGVNYAAGTIKKLEELKVLKLTLGAGD